MTVLIIESPLQALNAVNFIKSRELLYYKIYVIRTSNPRSFSWSINIIEYYGLNSHLISVDWSPSYNDNILTVFPRLYSLNRKIKCDTLILGDYKSTNMRFLASYGTYSNLILLDDGTATIDFVNHQSNFTLGKSSLKEWALVKIFGVKRLYEFNPTLYTIYDKLDYEKTLKCSYKGLNKFNLNVNNNKVFVIGSAFVEKRTLDKKNYLEAMSNVGKFVKYYDIYYIPHRGESHQNLEEIKLRLGWNILRIKTIVENALIQMEELPFMIVGISSSALPNIHEIFKDEIDVRFYEIKSNLFNVKQSSYQSIYDVFEGHFNIEKLNK